MRRSNVKFNTAFISEPGSFIRNKDYFAFAEMDNFACYFMADGIDDDLEQESAKIAVDSMIRQFSENPSMEKREIQGWLETANKELVARSKSMRLKASITVFVTDYAFMMFGMTGNTRLYLFREGNLIHRSIDQSLSSNLVEGGKLSTAKIASHLERHNLYCYLGQQEGFNAEVSGRIKLVDGDKITMLTRGIWENIDIGEMTDAVKDAQDPQKVLNNVVSLLLSRKPFNLDNYTLATIFIDKAYQVSSLHKALARKIVIAMLPVLIMMVALLVFFAG